MLLTLTLFGIWCPIKAEIKRQSMSNVSLTALLNEVTFNFDGGRPTKLDFAMWIPNECLLATMEQNPDIADTYKTSKTHALKGVSMLAIMQVHEGSNGPSFYKRDQILEGLTIFYVGEQGKPRRVHTASKTAVDERSELLENFASMLKQMMGLAGQNMQIFLLDDTSTSSERLINPYTEGNLTIILGNRSGEPVTAQISFPLDSLHIPRKCPNGSDAHVSWKFCPWTGQPLSE